MPPWPGIERFVHETAAASEEHDLPVDDGVLMLLLAARQESADLDQRKLPRGLLPEAHWPTRRPTPPSGSCGCGRQPN